MKRIATNIVVGLIVVLGIAGVLADVQVSRVRAQDATSLPEATPPAVVVVPSTDQTTVIPGTTETPTIIIAPAPAFNPIVLVVGAVLLMLVGFGLAVLHGKNPDTAAVEQVRTLRQNQPVMDDVRAGYEHSSDQVKSLVETLQTVVTAIAPLTPIKIDDELSLLLQDITDKEAAKQALLTVQAQQAVAPAPIPPTPPTG